MKNEIRNLCLISLALFSIEVFACQDGYYRDDFGFCLPGGSTIVHTLDPTPDLLRIGDALVKGNVQALTDAIGSAVVKGSCPACAVMLSGKDKAFVERVVGRGWLIYMTTGDPVLVLADAATSIAKGIELGKEEPEVFSAPPTKIRDPIAYSSSEATCIVRHIETGKITVGWVDAPVLRAANGIEKVYPNVGILPVDTLKVTSNNDCPNVPEGQEKLTEIVITMNRTQAVPGEGGVMKYFFMGKAA